jgi:hypothetical protein
MIMYCFIGGMFEICWFDRIFDPPVGNEVNFDARIDKHGRGHHGG